MKTWKPAMIVATAGALLAAHGVNAKETACTCGGIKGEMLAPAKMITLPDEFNSPDGMTIGKDGLIYLSINNVSDQTHPAKIGRISPDGKVSVFSDLPAHPKTGKASLLGIAFGSDGNLYVADNQASVTEDAGMSRLLRVNIKDGKAVGTDVVVTGMTMANGVSSHGDLIVVNDTAIAKDYPLKSGTYRFTVAELKQGDGGKPIQAKGLDDPHLIARFETNNKDQQVGANGVGFDSKGNLFVCNFGDAEVWKVTFGKDGKVQKKALFCKGQGLESADGLQVDADDHLWVADFLGNAIARICPNGTVKIIAKNEPGDGKDGRLDAPSECIRHGKKVYVSNIDLTYGPNQADSLHSISVFELP
ncbi:MAG: SMP-30/gluconolactonase/LRE family protein [Akkermansiaceae bacterium]|nr:SMP-30/gluconolactonase/LRE family protein [Akkermansiaceae bacterium]